MGLVGEQLWAQAGIAPEDVQVAILYDHFTPFVLIQLEELGFCPRGEARNFIADGAIEVGGRLPLNTHGGQLGEAYIHGMNGIAEGVRQLRGHFGEPGRRRRERARHGRHRRADIRVWSCPGERRGEAWSPARAVSRPARTATPRRRR